MPMRSLATRQSLWLLTAASLIVLSIGAFVFPMTNALIVRNLEAWNGVAAERGAKMLGSRLDDVLASTHLLRTLLEGELAPQQERQALRGVLDANPMLAGIAILRPAQASPFWFRTGAGPRFRDLAADVAGYRDALWFRKGLVCMQGCWGETFQSGARYTEMLHYSLPLPKPGGAPDSMISADVELRWLDRHLRDLSRGRVVAFVFDRQAGRVLAHPDRDNQGKLLSQMVDLQRGETAQDAPLAFRSQTPTNTRAWSIMRRMPVRYYLAPVPGSSWTLVLSMPQHAMLAEVRKIQWIAAALALLGMLMLAAFVRLYLVRSLRPLRTLDRAIGEVAAGKLDSHLPAPARADEVGRLTQSFSRMQEQLRGYLSELQSESARRERAQSEMDIAQQIQTSMLPRPAELAGMHAVDVAGYLQAQAGVGGDFYTYLPMDGNRLYFMLGDVSGKGLPASLFMARTITLARVVARRFESPAQAMRAINRELLVNNEACMFVTAVCGVLDLASGELRLSCAGHEPGILRGAGIAARWLELENGPPLGLDGDAAFPEKTLQLVPGQALLFYTDGLTESRDMQGRMFGADALLAATHDAPAPASLLVRHLLAAMTRHEGDAPPVDDVTLLVVRWLPPEYAIDLSIASTRAGVAEAMRWIGRHAAQLGLDRDGAQDVRLVAEELLVNAIEHGYPGGRHGRMQLSLLRRRRWVTLRIDDDAEPFDPTAPVAEPEHDDDLRALGGAGLYLTQQLTSALRYHRSQAGNHVEADFPLPPTTERDRNGA